MDKSAHGSIRRSPMGKQKNEDQIHETAAMDMAVVMAQLVKKYRHYPKILAMVLTDSLGAYLAMVSDTPQKAIDIAVKRLQNVEINQVRASYYGFKLGVVENDREETTPPTASPGSPSVSESGAPVFQGEPRGRRPDGEVSS
jgi:hypothetical protein